MSGLLRLQYLQLQPGRKPVRLHRPINARTRPVHDPHGFRYAVFKTVSHVFSRPYDCEGLVIKILAVVVREPGRRIFPHEWAYSYGFCSGFPEPFSFPSFDFLFAVANGNASGSGTNFDDIGNDV